jgi:hypothetical protein
MDWIKLYFSSRRFKIVLHGLYFLMCMLLTAMILSCFGIRYIFPERIDLAAILGYLLDGDVLMPLLTFLLVFGLFNPMNKGLNYLLYRMIRSKIPLFRGLRQGVTKMAFRLKCFEWVDGKYKKMANYDQFRGIVNSFHGSPINIMDFAARFNSVVLSSWLCLLLYPQGGALRMFYLLIGGLFYVYHLVNLLFLREVKANIDFFRQIVEEIDQDEDLSMTDRPPASTRV